MNCKCGYEIKFCPECGEPLIKLEQAQELKPSKLQTVQEFADSKNVSVSIVNNWVYRYGLPVIRIGRRVYIEESDFTTWIQEHKQTSTVKKEEVEIPIQPQRKKSLIAGKIKRIY